MKSALLVILFCVVYVVYGEEYETRDVDIDSILNNERLLQNFVKCFLDKGPCTPDGEEIKSHIKEALEDGCAKCNDKHKEGIRKVITFLVKNKKDTWEELKAKYDPEGTYKEKYADLLKEVQ